MAITQEDMDAISRSLLMPLMLLIDFGLFQYLVSVYYSRRHERRVQMLLLSSFIGFASHVYAHEDDETMMNFNDISEVCSQLMFLIQITIIGHAVRAKVKLRSITWFTYVAEMMIVLDWVNMLGSAIQASGVKFGDEMHTFSNVVESLTLTFVPVFRFFYLSLSGGFRRVLRERKLEMFMYFVVATHEYVFVALGYATGVSWEYPQGVYMRGSIAICILLNLHKKIKNSASRMTTNGAVSSSANDNTPTPRAFNAVLPISKAPVASSIQSAFGTSLKSGTSASSNITKIGVHGPTPHQVQRG